MSLVCSGVSSCFNPVPCTKGVTTASPHRASCGISDCGNPKMLANTRCGSGRAKWLTNSTEPSLIHSSIKSFTCFVIISRCRVAPVPTHGSVSSLRCLMYNSWLGRRATIEACINERYVLNVSSAERPCAAISVTRCCPTLVNRAGSLTTMAISACFVRT